MLKKLTVENYKAFKEPTSIEFRPITVLLGKNSSGKSSLCKLISVLSYVLSENCKDIFSMLDKDVMLGSINSELFHTNILSKLKFDLEFDNTATMSLNYMMTGGDFILHEYKVRQEDIHVDVTFKKKEEIVGRFFSPTNNEYFNSGGFNPNKFRYKVNYIGPVRIQAKRSLYAATMNVIDITKVGYRGENTSAILLNSFLNEGELFRRVSSWYYEHMDGQSLDFIRNGERSGNYSLMVKRGDTVVNLADVGEGTNQLLPVITQTFLNNADLTIIEQAGLHLHPSAHANLAYRIAEAATSSGKTYVVESHSANFILGLRNRVAHHKIDPKDVAIYFIDHDGESATATLYEIESDGSMTDWPAGIFAEDFQLLKEINQAKK